MDKMIGADVWRLDGMILVKGGDLTERNDVEFGLWSQEHRGW